MRNVCLVSLILLLPAAAVAQQASTSTAPSSASTRGYVAVHVGGQAGSSSSQDTFTFSAYDETATVMNDQDYGGGFLFNIEGGYAFVPHVAAGLAITRASSDANTRLSATIPHPQLFDRPRTATFDGSDTTHSETGYHFFVSYLIPASERFDVRVFAGPSIFRVSHDLVSAITFTETSPFTSVTITGATVDERTKTVGAFHVGAGGTYRITDRLGVDGFFRFARRTVDLPNVSGGTTELKIGGAQLGVGARIAF
jgi:opacity protein-like surface antigen